MKISSRWILAAAGLALAAGVPARAEEAAAKAKKPTHAAMKAEPIHMAPGDVKWGDAPPNLPAGAKLAVLQGDPGKAGPYTVRLQAPDGYKVMPHWHPTAENLTVISGEFHVGMGDAFDDAKGETLPAGSFASMPAHMHHYGWMKGETIVQIHGQGPFQLVYVNAKDDPSGMQGKTPAAKKMKSEPAKK